MARSLVAGSIGSAAEGAFMPSSRFGFTLAEWAIIVLVIAVFMANVARSGDGWKRILVEGSIWVILTVIVSLVFWTGLSSESGGMIHFWPFHDTVDCTGNQRADVAEAGVRHTVAISA